MPSIGNDSGGCARRNRRTSSANRRSVSVSAKSIFIGAPRPAAGLFGSLASRSLGAPAPGRLCGSHDTPRRPARALLAAEYTPAHALRVLSADARRDGDAGGARGPRDAWRGAGLRLRDDRRPPASPGTRTRSRASFRGRATRSTITRTITSTVVPPSAVASVATATSHGGPMGLRGSFGSRR